MPAIYRPPDLKKPTSSGCGERKGTCRGFIWSIGLHASGMQEATALLATISDPSQEAIVENLNTGWIGSGAKNSTVQTVSYTNNRVELNVHAAGNLFLVSSEVYYPGWSATLNGKPIELLPTNLAFRGLPVPAGDSRIVMQFRPDYLVPSIMMSILGLAACVAMLVWPA